MECLANFFIGGAKKGTDPNLAAPHHTPDFYVDDSIKQAAIDAILQDKNGYTQTAGIEELLHSIHNRLH